MRSVVSCVGVALAVFLSQVSFAQQGVEATDPELDQAAPEVSPGPTAPPARKRDLSPEERKAREGKKKDQKKKRKHRPATPAEPDRGGKQADPDSQCSIADDGQSGRTLNTRRRLIPAVFLKKVESTAPAEPVPPEPGDEAQALQAEVVIVRVNPCGRARKSPKGLRPDLAYSQGAVDCFGDAPSDSSTRFSVPADFYPARYEGEPGRSPAGVTSEEDAGINEQGVKTCSRDEKRTAMGLRADVAYHLSYLDCTGS